MADNVDLPITGTGTSGPVKVASRTVTYSSDSVQAPAVGIGVFAGSDDAKTFTDVTGTAPLPTGQKAATSTLTNVSASASNVTVLASNTNRLGAVIVNDSTSIVYLKYGATASSTSYTYKLAAGGVLEITKDELWYTGIIDGIWASANGSARVTELTA